MQNKELVTIVMEQLRSMYGDNPNKIITDRFVAELDIITTKGYEKYFFTALEIAKFVRANALDVHGSFGITSMFVAFLLGITNNNPIPSHYFCLNCKLTEFMDDVEDGYDLIDKKCPTCGSLMCVDGHNIALSVILGYDGGHEPRISFTVPFGYKQKILDHLNRNQANYYLLSDTHKIRKDEQTLELRESHLINRLYELDGITGLRVSDIPIKSKELFDFYVKECSYDEYTSNVLAILKPKSFSDLVSVNGLAHGVGTWQGNADNLILSEAIDKYDLIATRDDIQEFLLRHGVGLRDACDIMEYVRKGRANSGGFSEKHLSIFREHGVPNWYIESLSKIRYTLPRSVAISNVRLDLQLAWYKMNYPEIYSQVEKAIPSPQNL